MDLKKKILIVDDELINLEFFDLMLSKLGYHVERADNGDDALHLIRRIKPDLVVLDVLMPGISGWDVMEKLKKAPEYAEFRETPVIIFSGLDEVKDKVQGFELGVDDYITKPFNFSEVLARIKNVLKNHELILQLEKRENRIKIVEELNHGLMKFVESIEEPLEEQKLAAATLSSGNHEIDAFIARTKADAAKYLKEIESLKKTIEKLRQEEARLKTMETEIKTLRKEIRQMPQSKNSV